MTETLHLQARHSLLPLINKIAENKSLLQTGKYQGKLKFPWGYAGVMTKWTKNWVKKQEGLNQIRSIIFPEIKIHQMDLFQERKEDIVYVMDYLQKKEARSLGGEHRVIHDVAGSGKTVLLRHRAKVLSSVTQMNRF